MTATGSTALIIDVNINMCISGMSALNIPMRPTAHSDRPELEQKHFLIDLSNKLHFLKYKLFLNSNNQIF